MNVDWFWVVVTVVLSIVAVSISIDSYIDKVSAGVQRCQEYPGAVLINQRTQLLTGELSCSYRPAKEK